MPKSRNRKQHKEKKVKNRKALELQRAQQKDKMNRFMTELIEKMNKDKAEAALAAQEEANIPVLDGTEDVSVLNEIAPTVDQSGSNNDFLHSNVD